jgi:hypothetical protein
VIKHGTPSSLLLYSLLAAARPARPGTEWSG